MALQTVLKGVAMIEDCMNAVEKFAKGNNLVLCGVLLVVGGFLLSFCYKTFWGQWKDRAKEKQIYGEPMNRNSHLKRHNKTGRR